jgi:predicted ATPase/class 3 adenylate cyclase
MTKNTTCDAGLAVPHRVFLSYRRTDTAGYAGRLNEDLRRRLGSDNVFIDVENIQPGANFEDVLKETVSRCDTLLVLIGRLWLEPGLDGTRRLDDPKDYVGFEIAHALATGKRTIPVLLDGARFPSPGELPDRVAGLAKLQAFTVSDRHWSLDVDLLVQTMRGVTSRSVPWTSDDEAADSLPQGTVALLFTDIEGSTALLTKVGIEVYSQILSDHHELMRSAIKAHDGTEVDTSGDSFFVVFSSSRDCVAAAAEMQRSLESHSWPGSEHPRVRMGIHTGEAQHTTAGLVGLDVHRASRISSAAHGGQVLLSETTMSVVRDSMPEGLSYRDLGMHRLKDLGRPQQIFQLVVEGLENDFAPIRSLENPKLRNNLPAQLSSFIGRATQLGEVRELVKDSRLVTLTGAGGSGKTRLALQVGAELLDGSGEGVWFVDLAPVSEPGLVSSTVAQAIGVREEPGRAVSETLVEAVGDRYLLILLDNCEHLIDASAKLVDSLMRSCSRVHVLATSREPLAITGERVYRVPTMTVPAEDDDPTTTSSEAVELFTERAAEVRPGFVVDGNNAEAIASICRRIDGVPLAIELAAARVASMDVSEIEARLNKRFSLLTTTNRSVLPRQQTLRALVDWSYGLLTALERETLCRLSVFAGGWDLSAAEAVCVTEETEIFELADLLRSLVDKSLVQTDETPFGLRYGLLETIRQFASEKRAEDAISDLSARDAQARYFLELAERAAPELHGRDQARWLDRLEIEKGNLRVATERFLSEPGAGIEALRLVVALARFFQARHVREGVEALTAALGHDDLEEPNVLRAEALGALGELTEGRGRRRYIEEGIEIARKFDDQSLTAQLLTGLSWCAFQEGDLKDSAVLSEEAISLAGSTGDQGLLGRALVRRAVAVGHLDPAMATPASEEAIWALRRAGDRRWEATALCNLASFEVIAGDLEDANSHYSDALVIVEELRDSSGANVILAGMAEAAMLSGDLTRAVDLYSKSLVIAHREREMRSVAYVLSDLAQCIDRLGGDPGLAATLYGAADAQNEALGLPWQVGFNEDRDESVAALKAHMGSDEFDSAYSVGWGLSLDAAVSLALEKTR